MKIKMTEVKLYIFIISIDKTINCEMTNGNLHNGN